MSTLEPSKPNPSSYETLVQTVDPDGKWLYRVGGISGIALGIAYVIIIVLYVPIGAPPNGAAARLTYLGGNPLAWWAILGLSVLTDLLFVPLAFALYLALKGINRNLMLIATAFIGLFVVLDLAITWPTYGALITLGGDYLAARDETLRAALITAATFPTAVLESTLLGFYIILVPGLGILMTGLVMLKGIFNKLTAFVGVAIGIFAVVSTVGPFITNVLGLTVIVTSILTTIWVMLAGYRLYRLGQE